VEGEIVKWFIITLCLPLTVPMILLGAIVRILLSAFLFGYDSVNIFLESVWNDL
jgi:hypothetical protein